MWLLVCLEITFSSWTSSQTYFIPNYFQVKWGTFFWSDYSWEIIFHVPDLTQFLLHLPLSLSSQMCPLLSLWKLFPFKLTSHIPSLLAIASLFFLSMSFLVHCYIFWIHKSGKYWLTECILAFSCRLVFELSKSPFPLEN